MLHLLVDLYQFCSYNAPGVKTGPASWVASLNIGTKLSSVNNFFKHLLLNHWASLDETWQGSSLDKALQNLFKEFNSTHNSGCHGNQKEKMQNL